MEARAWEGPHTTQTAALGTTAAALKTLHPLSWLPALLLAGCCLKMVHITEQQSNQSTSGQTTKGSQQEYKSERQAWRHCLSSMTTAWHAMLRFSPRLSTFSCVLALMLTTL